jgi:hypothetical protein
VKNFAQVCHGIAHAFAPVSDMSLQGGQWALFESAALEMHQSALSMRGPNKTVALRLWLWLWLWHGLAGSKFLSNS